MKRRIGYFVLIFTLSIFVSGFLWIFNEFKNRDSESVSPLPEFLTLSKNDQVKLLDLWFPKAEKAESLILGAKDITARSALIYNISKDDVIFEKEPDKRLPMASLTKIMTAMIAIDNKLDNNSYLVTEDSLVGENSMGLTAGEVLKMEDLLYGLMLPSGNDAAEVLASNYPTGREGFVVAMNQKAESLGLKNTNFTNPSGLQGDGDQYSTTYDLLILTKYAMENYPLFAKVVSTAEYTIPKTNNHKAYKLYNETNLLTTYEGVKGVKTGFTDEAGLCLVTYLEYKGHKIVAIILNSTDRRAEMRNLLDYALSAYGITPPKYKG